MISEHYPDSILEKCIVDSNSTSHVKALAIKQIDFENICKTSDLWHCFQIIMPLLTDSDEAIQLALIDNPSLYKFDDLRIAVLKILQYSKSRKVASKAQAIMAEDWFKMVRKLNKNAEAGLPFESPVKEDFLNYCPQLTKNLSMADHYNQDPDTEEDFKDYPMKTKNNVNDDKFREELRKAITEAFNVHGERLEKVLRIFMEKHKAVK